ncbi:MAG: HAMP domain-containing protein [Proteobacteria bacterium]|nr:HAMP domain-containing protein [Pseudomonadota bacterium]
MLQAIRKSLSRKILLATAGTMAVLLGLLSWAIGRDHRATVEALERRTNASFATFVYNTLLLSMMEGKMDDLQRILQNAVGTQGIHSIRLVRVDGTVRYSGRTGEVGQRATDPLVLELVEQGQTSPAMLDRQRDGIIFNAVPLHNPAQGQCFSCHGDDGPYLGAIVMGFDLSEFDEKLASSRRRQWIGLGLTVVCVVAVVYLCLRFLVLRPLFRVVDGAQRMAHGDLTRPVAATASDEMGDLARHINTLRSHLRDNVEESFSVAEALAEAVGELNLSSESLVSVAMEQCSGAAEQASAVQEATTTAEEIAATSNEISANVESVKHVAEETYGASVRGREAVRAAVSGMGEVKDQVRAIADAMLGLGKRSQKIGGIVDIIDEISEQTHLLALNAAIEAAGAGEHGKRFSVVAAEIRRLAERTVEATTEIKGLIEEIQDSTSETVMSTERGTAIAMEGAGRVDKIGESLEGILSLVRQTKESTREITVATQQQATAGEQLVLTITDINEVAVQVNRSAEQVEKSVIRLKDLARKLKELAEANRSIRKFTV